MTNHKSLGGDSLNGYDTRLWIDHSGFMPWPETLCCVLGQDTSLSQVYKWVAVNCLGNLTECS